MDATSLQKLLRQHYVAGIQHSHVSMGNIKARYQFSKQELEEFWKIYNDLVYNNDRIWNPSETEIPIHIGVAEKILGNGSPILVDVDLKFKDEDMGDYDDTGIHTDKHIEDLVRIYQTVLRNILEECKDEMLICVVFEKPLYRIKKGEVDYVSHGLHLSFPSCFMRPINIEEHLYPRVVDMINKEKVFVDLGIEDASKIIDKGSCRVNTPWLLYGSTKDVGMTPYKVSKIYDAEGNIVSLEEAFRYFTLFDSKDRRIDIRGKVEYYLPQILSVFPYNKQVNDVKRGISIPAKEKFETKKKENIKQHKKTTVQEDIKTATKLLPMISKHRAEDYNEWMMIGWVLYNISEGSPEGLDLWNEFSQQIGEKYDEKVCFHQWEKMVMKDYTIGTLKHLANIDNAELYKEYRISEAKPHINNCLNGSHFDVAQILYAHYGTEFVCASISNKTWYQFNNNRWELIEEGVFLRNKISTEIVSIFLGLKKDMKKEADEVDENNKADQKRVEIVQKQLSMILKNLKTTTFKNSVMKEAADLFYDKRFREKLDTNPALFPFINGVYDLNLNLFRPGKPEDFISKTCGIEYIEFSEEDNRVIAVHDFLEKIFPDKSIRDYFKDVASDLFLGGNHQKNVYFWTGEGDNGKSVTQNILEKMLGKLAIKFNTTVITGKKVQSGSANPELARAGGGVRLAVMEEPDGDEMINVGVLKAMSGNDSYLARDLFEKGKEAREITPLFKLIFICNKLPKLRYSDKATWNRIRVIPFESTFCREDDPAPDTYEEQLRQKRFPMDKDFGKKIPSLLQPLAWILLRHRLNIKTRFEPEKVRSATAMYRKQNDVYRQFIEENIVEDKVSILSLQELYSQFKTWFKESMPNITMPIKNEVEEYFTKLWDEPLMGKKWKGYRIKTLRDDIIDGNAILIEPNDLADYDENGSKLPSETKQNFLGL